MSAHDGLLVGLGALALVVAWLCHLLGARALLHQAGEQRAGVTTAFAWAWAMAGPAMIGRLVPDTVWAVTLSSMVALGVVVVLWRRVPETHPPRRSPAPVGWGFSLLHGLLFLLVADTCVEGYWWDEHSAHNGLTSVMAHGVFPPEFPLYPGEAFRYHYGFDVLAAEVRAFTGVSAAHALDAISILTFGLLLLVAREAGARLAGSPGAALAPLLVPLGSGTLQFLLFIDLGPLELKVDWMPEAFGRGMPPPVISNFFQHPQGLGMPLALAVFLLFDDGSARRLRVLLGAVLLGMISLAQVVFFLLSGLALGAQVILRAISRRRIREPAIELLLLACALLLARMLGGFFSPASSSMKSMVLFGKGHFQGDALAVMAQHLVMFGLPFVALPIIAARATALREPLRWALLVAVVAGFVIPGVVRYERSWDMVKLYGAGGFFLNLLFADLLGGFLRSGANILSSEPGQASRRAWGRALLVGTLTLLSTFTGLHFLIRMGPLDGRFGVPNMHFPGPNELAERAGDALAQRMDDPRDYVLVPDWLMGISAGLLAPGHDWRRAGGAWMLDRARLDRWKPPFERAKRDLHPDDLDALGVRWALLQPHEIHRLSREGRQRLEQDFEQLEVIEHRGGRITLFRRRPGKAGLSAPRPSPAR